MTDSKQLPVLIEFSGGAELLFGNQKKLNIQLDVDEEKPWTLRKLIHHLRDKYLQERPELFCNGDTVRPGILVLVNDTDWELLGDLDYRIQPNDNILFISTLHGG